MAVSDKLLGEIPAATPLSPIHSTIEKIFELWGAVMWHAERLPPGFERYTKELDHTMNATQKLLDETAKLKSGIDKSAAPVVVAPSPSSGGLTVVHGDPGPLDVGGDLANLRAATQENLRTLWNTSNKLAMSALTELHSALNKLIVALPKSAGLLDHLIKSATDLDEVKTDDAAQAIEGIEAVLAGCSIGITDDEEVLNKLMAVAGMLDDNYKHGAADLLDKVALAYEYKGTPLSESRKDLYDSEKHNADNMWEHAKREIAENRSQDAVETHRDNAISLSTRYSPDLPGVQMYHVSDGVYQDSVTHKTYDYRTGYTLDDGTKVPGGNVANQTPTLTQYSNPSRLFDTRVELSKRKSSAEVAMTKVSARKNKLPMPDVELTDADIAAMKEWARDCYWKEQDYDEDFLKDLSKEELIAGVHNNYEGGLKQFLIDAEPVFIGLPK